MSGIVPVLPGSGSDPLALWRGVDDAVRASRPPRGEPPILPPAVILPRTAPWMNPEPAASAPAPLSRPLLQTA